MLQTTTDNVSFATGFKFTHNIQQETKPFVLAEAKQIDVHLTSAPHQRTSKGMTATSLGNQAFKKAYNLKYAYVCGAMSNGISSKELVIKMGKAGLMGYFGTNGVQLPDIEQAICVIQKALKQGQAYGMNLLCDFTNPQLEADTIDLFLKYDIRNIEAAGYLQITPALVKYRLKGLKRETNGKITATNHIMVRVSRPEVAQAFLSPAPEEIVNTLLEKQQISREAAILAKEMPMADDLCVQADSGGPTSQGILPVLLPTMIKLRDEMMARFSYANTVRVGAMGGIGTPEAAAAAFILNADFIMTHSINQCTVEAGTSDTVKDLLQQVNVQDTGYAPAGDAFGFGAKMQVVQKGLLFAARANRLYELYHHYNSLDDIDDKTKRQIEEDYFKCRFEEVYAQIKAEYAQNNPQEIEKAEHYPKYKMALIFRRYFTHTMRLALDGNIKQKVDYQIHCGPAMGAFNQWVKGTALENWRNRHVDEIAEKLMQETAALLNQRFQELTC